MTHRDGKKTAVGEDEESDTTFEDDVLSDVKRQRSKPAVFWTHNTTSCTSNINLLVSVMF